MLTLVFSVPRPRTKIAPRAARRCLVSRLVDDIQVMALSDDDDDDDLEFLATIAHRLRIEGKSHGRL